MTINDSHIDPEMTFRKLVFLNMQQLTNFPYIEKDFDAVTDYQLLCKVVEYLNMVINNSNNQNDSITNLYNAFISLQDYVNTNFDDLETAFNNLESFVNNYFDNLDVQEEINNKLDDMLESGTLQEIIDEFLQSTAVWCFDTVADMKQATNLVNGSYARTLGYYEVNDNGGALYKITNTTSATNHQEEVGELYATLISNKNNPLCYGAKQNDNTYDNTLILSEMITLGITNIEFPKGRYYFLTTLTPVSYLTISGNQSRFDYTGTGYFIERTENTDIINVKIKDCNIYGDSSNNCFNLKRLVDSIIENVRIDAFSLGIRFNYCWDNLIQRVRIQNTTTPFILESQTNNVLFSNCSFSTFTSRIEITNNEGLEFNSCEFNNCSAGSCILSYASSISFINCYYEDISNTFLSSSGSSVNQINIYGGKCSDSALLIYAGTSNVMFNTVKHGKVKILPVNTPTNNPAVTDSLISLDMPSNAMGNKFNSPLYFTGAYDVTLDLDGTGTTKTFTNGELVFSNSNEGRKGFYVSGLTVGKDYYFICEVDTVQENPTLSFAFSNNTMPDYSGFYSVSKSIANKYLICPFKATGQGLRVSWTHTNDVKFASIKVIEI